LLKKSASIREKAQAFDEKKTLNRLENNFINRFYYRFEDHIEELTCERSFINIKRCRENEKIFSFEFSGKDEMNSPRSEERGITSASLRYADLKVKFIIAFIPVLKDGVFC
jgi:hypothetical protein